MKNIVISGWYGVDNAGDDAILQQFIAEIITHSPANITVLSQHPDRVNVMFGSNRVNAIFHHRIFCSSAPANFIKGILGPYVKRIKKADLFVLGGGGLLRDNTSLRNLCRLLDEILLAKLFGKFVAFYAIGVGPFTTRFGTWLIKQAAKRCDLITVREEKSKRLLEQIGIESDRIYVVADPAFLLDSFPPKDEDLLRAVRTNSFVGLFPALGFINDGKDLSHVPHLAAALDELYERHKLRFMALPMRYVAGEIDDIHVANLIKQAMKHPFALEVYEHYLAPSELKWMTGQFAFNITIRLHAMIFSFGMETPVVAINYEPKVANIISSFGLEDYLVNMDEALQSKLVEAVERCMADIDSCREKIGQQLPKCQESANHTFQLMRQLLQH